MFNLHKPMYHSNFYMYAVLWVNTNICSSLSVTRHIIHGINEQHITMEISLITVASDWFEFHGGVGIWKRVPHHWPFMRGIQQSSVDSPPKGQVIWSFGFSLLLVRTRCWTNSLTKMRYHYAHTNKLYLILYYDVTTIPFTADMSQFNVKGSFCSSNTCPTQLKFRLLISPLELLRLQWNLYIRRIESHSHLTGAAAAKLRRHLSI